MDRRTWQPLDTLPPNTKGVFTDDFETHFWEGESDSEGRPPPVMSSRGRGWIHPEKWMPGTFNGPPR